MKFLLLLVISVAEILNFVSCAKLPPQNCPDYFQYLTDSTGQFIGKVTIPDLPNEMITVTLRLSQYEFPPEGVLGDMDHWIDEETSIKNLKDQKPIEMCVLFSTPKELPKVTQIAVNDIELCSADEYPQPSKRILQRVWFSPPNAKSRKDYAPLEEGYVFGYDTREDMKNVTI